MAFDYGAFPVPAVLSQVCGFALRKCLLKLQKGNH